MAGLVPGANAALTAENPDLTAVLVGFGWDVIPSRGPQSELVPIAVLCGEDGRALSDDHLVFFNQIESEDGSVAFASKDDMEEIDVDFSRIPPEVAKIAFFVYVDPDVRGPGDFAPVRSLHVTASTPQGRELVRFDVPMAESRGTKALHLAELYRHRDDWKFRAIGQGYSAGLAGIASDFRIDL
jgi:tellurium resistance protein TerD